MAERDANQTLPLPLRADLDPRATWDLDVLCPSVAEFDARFAAVSARLGDLERYRGRLAESSATLLAALHLRDALLLDVEHLLTWAQLRAAEDATNPLYLALEDRAAGLMSRAGTLAAWYEPELVELGRETLGRLADADASGELRVYAHYFDNLIRRANVVRSPEVEELLSMVDEPLASFQSTWVALVDADLRFDPLTDEAGRSVAFRQNGQYRYLLSSDRQVRRSAWERYADAYLARQHTFAATYAAQVRRNVFRARARGYASSLEAALDRNNLPPTIYHTLLASFDRQIDTWRRYFRVQARLLDVDRLQGWDLSEMPIPIEGRRAPEIGWEAGVELVLRSLAPLGDAYVDVVRTGIRQRWIDIHSNVGKRGGAFSGGAPGTYPYILMNWSGGLYQVSVLSHELGHSLHSYEAWRSQPPIYSWYGDVVSETASTVHQLLLARHLLDHASDDDLRLAVLQERTGSHLRYLFNMILLAKFELDCHERVERGAALTADGMLSLMADLYTHACGDDVVIDRERFGIRWAMMPHLYPGFYAWTYGAGTAAAAAIGQQILSEGAPAVERYLAMLRAGDSLYEHEVIRLGGADLSDPTVIQAAFDVLADYVDRLDALAG